VVAVAGDFLPLLSIVAMAVIDCLDEDDNQK
jgi:hypothetical protein